MSADAPAAFISYSRNDSEFALRLAADLKAAGAEVWIDQQDISPSEEWDIAIEGALRRSPRMLLLLSPDSVKSPAVRNEIALALHTKKPIIPVFYRECELPMQLLRIQYIDFRSDYERGFERLLKTLGIQPVRPESSKSSAAQQGEFDGLDFSGPPGAKAAREKRLAEDAAQARAIYEQIAADAERTKAERERRSADLQALIQATAAAKVPSENACPAVAPGMPLAPPIEAPVNVASAPPQARIPAKPSRLRELRTLIGHAGWVNAVAVTPDGQRAISASHDRTLKVWNLASGRELRTLKGHADDVEGVAVTPDGRLAVSASQDKTLKMWELGSGLGLRTLKGHAGLLMAVAVTPDGQRVVSTSRDQTLKVWDLASGRELRTFHVVFGSNSVAVMPDGQRVVSASKDWKLRVWDLASGDELLTLAGHTDWVSGVAVTPDGQCAVSASGDKTLKVWDLDSGQELRTLAGHVEKVTGVAVMPDGQRAVSTSSDQTLKVWDLVSGHELASFKADASLYCCTVCPDGKTILAGDSKGVIHCLILE